MAAPDDRPTATQIRELLAHLLAGAAGGSEERWAALIGDIEVLPIALHPRCNWRASARGTAAERDAIAKAIEVVAVEHPYARA